MPYLYGDPLKCTGCRVCELYCSLWHERVLNPRKARLGVMRAEPAIDKPMACRQCADPPCAKVCPPNAIARDAQADIVVVDEAKCIGCGACVEACPFGVIWLHPEKKIAMKCDLCMVCVPRCPVDALRVLTSEQFASKRRVDLVERLKPTLMERIPVPGVR